MQFIHVLRSFQAVHVRDWTPQYRSIFVILKSILFLSAPLPSLYIILMVCLLERPRQLTNTPNLNIIEGGRGATSEIC